MDEEAIEQQYRHPKLMQILEKYRWRELLPVLGLLLMTGIFIVLTEGRLIAYFNLAISQVFVISIAATGVFFVMTMGSLDFSQGSILGLSSIVVCYLSNFNIPLAIIAGIATGALIGAINGYFSVFRKIRSFIVTICTMFLFRGLIKFLTTKSPVGASFDLIRMDTMPLKICCALGVFFLFLFIFRYTRFGIHLKAIGAGEKAARFAGVKTNKTKFWVFVLAGALTGFAALINSMKIGSVTAAGGNQLETQIMIALVLGGMPISGGAKVKYNQIIIGSFMYVILNSGLIMCGASTQLLQLIEGIIFLFFVAFFADRKLLHIIK